MFKKKNKYYLIFYSSGKKQEFRKGLISGIHFNLVTVDQKEKDITRKYFLQFLHLFFWEAEIAGLFLQ